MAKVKNWYLEVAELAFKTEATTGKAQAKALSKWEEFLNTQQIVYGLPTVIMALDILYEIANQDGEIWDDFSSGHTWEELEAIYKVNN